MKQYLHFLSAAGKRLVSVDDVVEVIPMVLLQHDAESADEYFCGLLNYRGDIVPVFSLKKTVSDECLDVDFFLIITCCNNVMAAVLAHEVDYLVGIDAHDITTVSPKDGKAFRVAKINEEMVKIVNMEEFVA